MHTSAGMADVKLLANIDALNKDHSAPDLAFCMSKAVINI